jgi:hypothetical protein
MSRENTSPDLPLLSAVVYAGNGYPLTAGSFFTVLFESGSQREYDSLKERFGKAAVVGFSTQFESFFEYVLKEDPAARMFVPTWSAAVMMTSQAQAARPDPAVARPAFIAALRAAGTVPGKPFEARLLLDRLVTTAVRERATAYVDRSHGAGSAHSFESVLGAIIIDADKTTS